MKFYKCEKCQSLTKEKRLVCLVNNCGGIVTELIINTQK
jgi:hypothetical protein